MGANDFSLWREGVETAFRDSRLFDCPKVVKNFGSKYASAVTDLLLDSVNNYADVLCGSFSLKVFDQKRVYDAVVRRGARMRVLFDGTTSDIEDPRPGLERLELLRDQFDVGDRLQIKILNEPKAFHVGIFDGSDVRYELDPITREAWIAFNDKNFAAREEQRFAELWASGRPVEAADREKLKLGCAPAK